MREPDRQERMEKALYHLQEAKNYLVKEQEFAFAALTRDLEKLLTEKNDLLNKILNEDKPTRTWRPEAIKLILRHSFPNGKDEYGKPKYRMKNPDADYVLNDELTKILRVIECDNRDQPINGNTSQT